MTSAKDVINSIKPNLTKAPPGPTAKGSVGYDNSTPYPHSSHPYQ